LLAVGDLSTTTTTTTTTKTTTTKTTATTLQKQLIVSKSTTQTFEFCFEYTHGLECQDILSS